MNNYTATPAEFVHYVTELFDLISRGILKINIYKAYPFSTEGIQQAQKDLVAGKTIGKVIVDVNLSE